jgi:hypothetical protein
LQIRGGESQDWGESDAKAPDETVAVSVRAVPEERGSDLKVSRCKKERMVLEHRKDTCFGGCSGGRCIRITEIICKPRKGVRVGRKELLKYGKLKLSDIGMWKCSYLLISSEKISS